MLKANFHTHTIRCHHAEGTEREYIEKAIENGLTKLGFSDHTPYFYDGDYYSRDKMLPSELEGYVSSIRKLAEEYKKEIEIYCGLEVEYYPKYFDKLMEYFKPFNLDYMIIGQHYTKNETNGVFAFRGERHTKEDLVDYANQVVSGAKTGLFSYIAHPDAFLFEEDDGFYREQLRKICKTAKELSLPLEFNGAGYLLKRNYPSEKFLEVASEFGNEIIIGCDAHYPEFFDSCQEIAKDCDKLLKKYHLKRTEHIKLLDGRII